MRFQDRDAMTFKVFRKDADRIYPTRVRGSRICDWFSVNVPTHGVVNYCVVPSQKESRKTGYWFEIGFKEGKFNGACVLRVVNFLPVGFWPAFGKGKTIFEKIQSAWEEFKDLSRPEMISNFKDIKEDELLDRAQTDWVEFLRHRSAVTEALNDMYAKYLDYSEGSMSKEILGVLKRLGVIWDRYEKEQWGDIEFEDPCPAKEYERFI